MAGITRLKTGGLSVLLALAMTSCSTTLPETTSSSRHLEAPPTAPRTEDIPEVVTNLPLVPDPGDTIDPELYSFIIFDQPVRDVLEAIGRDASINTDIHPGIRGTASLNVIDQTIPQILNRLSRQSDIRWYFDDSGNLVVEPDTPYWKPYKVDYVNVQRNATSGVQVSTTIAQIGEASNTGAAGNVSSSSINLNTNNNFWGTLNQNLLAMLGSSDGEDEQQPVFINAESGLVNVLGTDKQHEQVASYLNAVLARALNQVLIEATVVEVRLSDTYQTGVDWNLLKDTGGFNFNFLQNNTSPTLQQSPNNLLTISSDNNNDLDITSTVRLLEQFGDLRVASSPKLLAMNNQPAIMRSADNLVYFDIEAQGALAADGVITNSTVTTNINTVPVGFFMNITAQIGDNDQVTLSVRPTITRQLGFVVDPNPLLAERNIESRIPQIQTIEFESVLKVFNGQIAVLGGLMQDSVEQNTSGLPVLSRIPGMRNLFSYRDDRESKTELVVFIRPVIVRNPSLEGDLSAYRPYLPQNGQP